MQVNLLKLSSGDWNAKVYNLTNVPLTGLNIYISCETSDIYNKLLNYSFDITLDDVTYTIGESSAGSSSLNQITYNREIGICKMTVHNSNDEQIGLIVGSDESTIGSDWASGKNTREVDDFVPLSIDMSSIANQETLKYISAGTILVINPIFYKSDLDNFQPTNPGGEDGGTRGFGEGGYGEGSYGGA